MECSHGMCSSVRYHADNLATWTGLEVVCSYKQYTRQFSVASEWGWYTRDSNHERTKGKSAALSPVLYLCLEDVCVCEVHPFVVHDETILWFGLIFPTRVIVCLIIGHRSTLRNSYTYCKTLGKGTQGCLFGEGVSRSWDIEIAFLLVQNVLVQLSFIFKCIFL